MLQNILATLFSDVLLLLSILILVPVTILFTECILALLPDTNKLQDMYTQVARPIVTVLIPAHNEKEVIEQTLTALLPQLTTQDKLIVIADNCTDNTADLARQFEVTVIERNDRSKIGKGYALDYGLRFIESDPPEVAIVIDADCIVSSDTIDRLALEVARTKRPVQAVYLMEGAIASNPKSLISALAFKIKNLVRPSGLNKLKLPCLLTGTGMAFPWSVIRHAPLASNNIVEDMQLGIDLAIARNAPLFCPQAQVTGVLPQAQNAANGQKMRWIHGHLQTLLTQVPRLIKASIVQRRFDLSAIALDLCVPPVSLLVMVWFLTLVGGLLVGIAWGQWAIAILSSLEGLLIFASIISAWAKFAREDISLKTLLSIPLYLLWKIPIFFAFVFKRQQAWVRTERDVNITFPQMFSLSSKIRAARGQTSSEVNEETIIFQVQSGSYFGLNKIGTHIWKLIQETQTIADLHNIILSEYAVTPEESLKDLLAILEQLATQELIEVTNQSVS